MPLFKSSASPSRSSLTLAPPSTTSSRSPSPSTGRGGMQDDTFRNVKLVEELLKAWNDHRQALAAVGKTGKRLANAMEELSQGVDKTSVTAQTLRPTASVLEQGAEVTSKWAKRVEKEYMAVNTVASSYFSLLAKETRSHEAYLLGINKRHAAAEKAYRKASKSLTDTASTHTALLHLQQALATDVQRANADHLSLLSTKQASLLLSVAAHAGGLGVGLSSYHSEGLNKAASGYKDIEYFRVLAEAQWTASLPNDLEDLDESKLREVMRIQKARVAMGELDIVGAEVWDKVEMRPRIGRVVSESVLNKYTAAPPRPVLPTSQSSAFSGSSMSMLTASSSTEMTSPTFSSPSTGTGKGSWGEMSKVTNPRPLPSPQEQPKPTFIPGHGMRTSSISIPTPRRSVSQIAAELEALTSSAGSGGTATATGKSAAATPPAPIQAERGNRRVTMPPVYYAALSSRTLPAVQPRRASAAQHFETTPDVPRGFPFPPTPDHGVASPTPKRPVRLSTAMLDLEHAAGVGT